MHKDIRFGSELMRCVMQTNGYGTNAQLRMPIVPCHCRLDWRISWRISCYSIFGRALARPYEIRFSRMVGCRKLNCAVAAHWGIQLRALRFRLMDRAFARSYGILGEWNLRIVVGREAWGRTGGNRREVMEIAVCSLAQSKFRKRDLMARFALSSYGSRFRSTLRNSFDVG